MESLYEKAWYAVTETCLAMTIFRDEWNVGFVLCFAGLLFAKGFCWLSSGRVEMVSRGCLFISSSLANGGLDSRQLLTSGCIDGANTPVSRLPQTSKSNILTIIV